MGNIFKDYRFDSAEELKDNLENLKQISEETGVSLENIINYIGYNLIYHGLESNFNMVNYTIEEIRDSLGGEL